MKIEIQIMANPIYILECLPWRKVGKVWKICDFFCQRSYPPKDNDDPYVRCSVHKLCSGENVDIWPDRTYRNMRPPSFLAAIQDLLIEYVLN